MATVPKVKKSRSNTRSRRANWKASAVGTIKCPSCGADTLPHRACVSCGTYKKKAYKAAEKPELQK
jgi:large subunit ribosomal protein L32